MGRLDDGTPFCWNPSMRARGAPNRHFNVAALENGKFIPGVGKINSGGGISAAALPGHDRGKRGTKKARIPPMPPASMLSEGQAAAAKNVVYFSNPQPLDIHKCPTLKQGGRGGTCTKSLPCDVSLPFAPLGLRRCLFFQHRTLILRVKGLSSALRRSAHQALCAQGGVTALTG